MPIELQIISGALQGCNQRFDGDRILIGDVDTADLQFESARDSGSRGKVAVLTLDNETGWQLANEGVGVWLVNQSPVTPGRSHHLRSDDLVRVSEMGPEFYFRLVGGPRGFAIPVDGTRKATETDAAISQSKVSNCVIKDDFSDIVIQDVPPHADEHAERAEAGNRADNLAGLRSKATPESVLAKAPHSDHADAVDGGQWSVVGVAKASSGEQNTVLESNQHVRPTGEKPFAESEDTPKPKRKIRAFSARSRLIGVLVSGLLGFVCAYCLACYVGGAKNDVYHIFHKK